MDREKFLDRVRQAARRGNAYRVHVPELPENVGYVGATGDLCERFADEVNQVGGAAQVFDDWNGARQQLRGIIAEQKCRSALCWQHDVLEQLQLDALLSEANVTRLDYDAIASLDSADRRNQAIEADIGITSADIAIAETGTLVVCSKAGQERISSLVPPIHVAVITAEQIVPDLLDAIPRLPQPLPSSTVLITGPSKTGDIELQLTTGVHGPGKWHVLIVREA
jgi:L-lactate dehydrogenase complex protein LldG